MLVQIADLMDVTGNTYTDDEVWRLTTLLNTASRKIQLYTGQILVRQTHVWKPRIAYSLRLPQMPNAEITSVTTLEDEALSYTFDGVEFVYVTNPSLIRFDLAPLCYPARVKITYEAGYEFIPQDIKSIACQMALRAYGVDPTKSGMTQESISNYSYQQGSTAAAGAVGMLGQEKEALKNYRRVVGSINMIGTTVSNTY